MSPAPDEEAHEVSGLRTVPADIEGRRDSRDEERLVYERVRARGEITDSERRCRFAGLQRHDVDSLLALGPGLDLELDLLVLVK